MSEFLKFTSSYAAKHIITRARYDKNPFRLCVSPTVAIKKLSDDRTEIIPLKMNVTNIPLKNKLILLFIKNLYSVRLKSFITIKLEMTSRAENFGVLKGS